ncbi:hypothetical protein ACXYMP_05770 [Aliiroseovarius sp. CAU 1755]
MSVTLSRVDTAGRSFDATFLCLGIHTTQDQAVTQVSIEAI